jgi:hypothetical protein
MWEQNKKSSQVRILILIVLVASFIPFSYLWYGQITNFKCAELNIQPNVREINPSDNQNNCTQQTGMHWAIFYGINGMIYSVPLMTLVLKSKRK